jgi:hypothetical protein
MPVFFRPAEGSQPLGVPRTHVQHWVLRVPFEKVTGHKGSQVKHHRFLAAMSSSGRGENLLQDRHLSLTVTKFGSVKLIFHYEFLGVLLAAP